MRSSQHVRFERDGAWTQDARSLNATSHHWWAARPVSISMADVGGVGSTTEELDGTQGAFLIVTVDGLLTSRRTVRSVPLHREAPN